jgi:hypothetical protein
MAMLKKHCGSCDGVVWHNATKTDHRCTYCGFPTSTNPGKKETQEFIRRLQVTKKGKLT